MATIQAVSVPIRYTVPDLEEGGKRFVVTPGMVNVRVIEPDEAPVVMKLRNGENMIIKESPYRCFDGKLYSPYKILNDHSKVFRADIMRNHNAWKGYVADKKRWGAAYYHPFLDNERRPYVAGKKITDVTFEPDAGEHPQYLSYLEDAQGKADRHLVLDGQAWLPCLGPVITYSRYFHRLNADHYVEPMRVFSNGFDNLVFDPFDIQAAVDVVERSKGRPVEIKGNLPEIFSREGYELDTLPLSVQGAAWGVLWGSRRVQASEVGVGFIQAVTGLRKAMSQAWTGLDIDFNVSQINHFTNPFFGRDIPDPTLLLGPLRTAVEAYDDQLPGNGGLVANWMTTVERLDARVHPEHEDDVAMLGGISL